MWLKIGVNFEYKANLFLNFLTPTISILILPYPAFCWTGARSHKFVFPSSFPRSYLYNSKLWLVNAVHKVFIARLSLVRINLLSKPKWVKNGNRYVTLKQEMKLPCAQWKNHLWHSTYHKMNKDDMCTQRLHCCSAWTWTK